MGINQLGSWSFLSYMRRGYLLINGGKQVLRPYCCFFVAHSGRLNCMIIHLGALIYPLPVALNVGLFCKAALRISNEPAAQSVSLSEGAYFRAHFFGRTTGECASICGIFYVGKYKGYVCLPTLCVYIKLKTKQKKNADNKKQAWNKMLFFLDNCDRMMAVMRLQYVPFSAVHIITTCCSDSWILSVTRWWGDIWAYFATAYLTTGGLLISAGPCPLQGQSRSAVRVSHCLDPFTSVVNE